MVELLVLVSVALLVVGVLGSVAPLLPSGLLSLAGVLLYWGQTGYSEPSLFVLLGFTAVALVTVAVDLFAGAFAAKAGGASTLTTTIAAVIGVALVFVAGPLGIIAGIAGTVFLIEYWRGDGVRDGVRAAVYATVGTLGSSVAQLLLTTSMLVAFLLVVL